MCPKRCKIVNSAKEAFKSRNILKGLGAAGKGLLGAGLVCMAVGIATKLGSLLGNTLYDSAKNSELRDQADGEAVLRKRQAIGKIMQAHQG